MHEQPKLAPSISALLALLLAGACSEDAGSQDPAIDTAAGGTTNGTVTTGLATTTASTATSTNTTAGSATTGASSNAASSMGTGSSATGSSGTGGATSSSVTGGAPGSSATDSSASSAGGAVTTTTMGDTSGATTGATTTGGGGSPSSDQYPCDGDPGDYDAVVSISGNNARSAIQGALNGLTPNRTTKQSVLVQGDGSMGNNERIDIPSYTVLNVCGTITVTNANGSGDQAPFYARNRTDIEIPNATIRGVPLYGMFFREVSNLHLGRIDMRLDGQGLGFRIDNNPGSSNNWGRSNQVTNIRLDDIHVENTGGHGVETYGVDGLIIGTVVARSTGDSGVLLNATINAEVGLVDADDAATGTGYAGFRIANEAGKIGNEWPAGNIHVGEVRAVGGGRGIFCVSDSGGLTIDRLTLENNGNNSMLLENCHNVRIATESGTISGGGEVRISQRSDEHTPSSDISLGNLTITGTQLNESPCASNTVVCNVQGTVNACGQPLDQCPW